MKKWVLVGAVMLFFMTIVMGNKVVEQATSDQVPPTPFIGEELSSESGE